MTISDLRNTVMEIEMDYESKQRMIRNLSRMEKKSCRKEKVVKTAAAAAIMLMAVGTLSIPVRALVNSFVRERMENVPRKRYKQY